MRRAFTLIEAILALVILAGAIMACLQMRAQMLSGTRRQREIQRDDRADEALFQMLINNVLPEPEIRSGEAPTWRGDYLGRPYVIQKFPMVVPNPIAGTVAYPVATEVTVFRYEVTYAGRTSEVIWNK